MVFPLVVNPRAGGRGVPLDAIADTLAAVGVTPRVETAKARLDEAVRAAVAAGAPVVGIAGGDGSMRAAGGILAGTSTALAVFPTGTLNHFSRSIGIDSIETAARSVAGGRVETLAVGYVEDEPFLNTATFGLYADVVSRRERLRRWLGKWLAALVAFNVTIARYRPLRLSLDMNGQRRERDTALIGVGIGHRSFPVTQVHSRLGEEPDLVLSILRARTRGGLFASGVRTSIPLLVGAPRDQSRDVEVLHAERFALSSAAGPPGVTLDGEIVRMPARVEVRIRRDALRVVVPITLRG